MAHTHTTYSRPLRGSDFSAASNPGLESVDDKKFRLRLELIEAGMTAYGLRKFNSRFLHRIIYDNEHVKAVIYGRIREGPSIFNLADHMIVATDRRVISLNHKPGYTDIDEFTYDIVDGVEMSLAGPFAAVTLRVKSRSFNVFFTNRRCADIFTRFIEKTRHEYFNARFLRRAFLQNDQLGGSSPAP